MAESKRAVHAVGVVGAGAMGRGIAQLCATGGCHVSLMDRSKKALDSALWAIQGEWLAAVEKNILTQEQVQDARARLTICSDLTGWRNVDLVVEAIIEDQQAKEALFAELENVVRPDCILATNTSSLSVTAIAAPCRHPERVVGWHFFNPVTRMKIAEVIPGTRTAPWVAPTIVALTGKLGHRAIQAADSPGFVVNHAGRAFVTEALKMLSEGLQHTTIDEALTSCAGFRLGPFRLLDLTGLDVTVPVMESIHSAYYGDDRLRPAYLARNRLVAGLLGRKTGIGFYKYPESTRSSNPMVRPEALPASLWWPEDGPAALPPRLIELYLAGGASRTSRDTAQALVLAPIDGDLTATAISLGVDPIRVVGIDPIFSSERGVTLMHCPATVFSARSAAASPFVRQGIEHFSISDSPGFIAPRVVACIVNLACEMAQQGVATPQDIDEAVKLGLGYPKGPFEWGDAIGPGTVLRTMEALHRTFQDPRYRPSPWLVRRAKLAMSLSAPDSR